MHLGHTLLATFLSGQKLSGQKQCQAQIPNVKTVLGGCSLKPSWPIDEATKLRHTAMLCLLEQELNISLQEFAVCLTILTTG